MQVSLRKDEGEQGNDLRHGDQVPLDDVFRHEISLLLYEIVERLLSQDGSVQLFRHTFQVEVLQIVHKLETRGI